MKKKSQPVQPCKAESMTITLPALKRGVRDSVVNRHGGAFVDKRKRANKRACRQSPPRSQE